MTCQVFDIGGDLPVRRLGFGAMRITGPGIWGPPPRRAEAIATLKRAVALGVNLIDTAESYGPYVSEELIAEALHPYPPGLVIATKGGFDRPGPDRWTVNARPERLREELEGSLRRLRLPRIDLYQLHRIDSAVPEEAQFEFLREAQRSGQIRHLGLSEAGVAQIERARKFFPVASVQNRYNVADREWEAVVDYCQRERIAFMPWQPLLAGDISRTVLRGLMDRLRGSSGGGAGARVALTRIAKTHGATPLQVALAWLLARADVMLPIPGTSSVAHLEENMRAADLQLSEAEISELT